jgi:hypothetical protein
MVLRFSEIAWEFYDDGLTEEQEKERIRRLENNLKRLLKPEEFLYSPLVKRQVK